MCGKKLLSGHFISAKKKNTEFLDVMNVSLERSEIQNSNRHDQEIYNTQTHTIKNILLSSVVICFSVYCNECNICLMGFAHLHIQTKVSVQVAEYIQLFYCCRCRIHILCTFYDLRCVWCIFRDSSFHIVAVDEHWFDKYSSSSHHPPSILFGRCPYIGRNVFWMGSRTNIIDR